MIKIKKPENFKLEHILECGQCFRWNKIKQHTYSGIIYNSAIEITECEEYLEIESNLQDKEQLEQIVKMYFNFGVDYKNIQKEILKHSPELIEAINYGNGIRILKQELWETIISFVISANNNIPRIKKTIEKISEKYGRKIIYKNKAYYTFPTPEELSVSSVQDLRDLGLGFRDKRVYELAQFFSKNDIRDYENVDDKSTDEIKQDLMKFNGIGEKVASCIILFAHNRYDIFPIDVWVRRIMNEMYFKKTNEKDLKQIEILEFAEAKYGKYAGIAQQYLFYWKRESDEKKK